MIATAIIVYHADAYGLVVFFGFLLLYVLLPGLLLLQSIRFNSGHTSSNLLIAFLSGWSLLVALYFLSDEINNNIPLLIVGPICSTLYLVLLYKRIFGCMIVGKFKILNLPLGFFAFAFLLMLYIMLQTQFHYMDPDYCSNIAPSIDRTYQMGLINVLSHDYPLIDPWVSGVTVHYHIFSQILLSVPMTLFDLPSDFLVMSCHPYLSALLLSLSMYSLFRFFCVRKELCGLYALTIVLSQMFIARNATTSYLFRIIFVNDNFGGYAISCMIACIIVISVAFDDIDAHNSSVYTCIALLTALTMLLTGIKAPVALVLIGAIIGTALLSLIIRSYSIKTILPIVFSPTIGFCIMYNIILGSTGTEGVHGNSIFKFGNITGICFWKAGLIEYLKSIGVPSFFRLLAILSCFAIFFFGAYLLPFTVGYIREFFLVIRKQKPFNFARVCVYASALIGFVMMMFLRYSGHSQVYFGSILIVLAPLISFWYFEEAKGGNNSFGKVIFNLCLISFFVMITLTSISFACDINELVPKAISRANPEISYDPYGSMSSDEYDAMMWIKENTNEDDLFATQMYSSVNLEDYNVSNRWLNTHFLYAAYSDRHFYLEGSGFTLEDSEVEKRVDMIRKNNRLFDEQNESRGDDAESIGVDYVVVTKKIYPDINLGYYDYKSVFSNDDVEIYQVIQ